MGGSVSPKFHQMPSDLSGFFVCFFLCRHVRDLIHAEHEVTLLKIQPTPVTPEPVCVGSSQSQRQQHHKQREVQHIM